MYRILLALSICFCHFQSVVGQVKKGAEYISPLRLPASFSGGFGELRRNHFHTGLDFRTAGQTGIPVFAVKSGSIVRVSASPTGYGHALYLMQKDGHTTVYGHLSRFNPKIESLVVKEQYRLKQFAIDLSIPPGTLSFEKGEQIAWSGNTGSSGGPHLHFEIRDTQSEKPQNPLFYLPGIVDKSSPKITSLYLYPISENSQVNKSRKKLRMETLSSPKSTVLKIKQPLEAYGEIGFGIQADDDFNGTGIKCGIFSAELWVDQKPLFSFHMDHLAFDQGRYVNSHIDYEELIRSKRWVHRLYLQPGNKMEIYQSGADRGILNMTDGLVHEVKIIVADAFGNSKTLKFKIASKKELTPSTKEHFTKIFKFGQANQFENEDVKVLLPEGALYDQLCFNYHAVPGKSNYYSGIHQIHDQYTPVHKAYQLSIRAKNIQPRYQSKAIVVMVDPSGRLSSVGGIFDKGWVTASPRLFGNFSIVLDTIPPTIKALSIKENKTLLNHEKIEFKIADNLSGIDFYEGELDGSWVLFEYDPKTETIAYTFDKSRITTGKMHQFRLTVRDERKNSSQYTASFYY